MKRHIAIVITLALLTCSFALQAQVSPEQRKAAKAEKAKKISELKQEEADKPADKTNLRAEKVKIIETLKNTPQEEKTTLSTSPKSTHNTEKKQATKQEEEKAAPTKEVKVEKKATSSQAQQEKKAFIEAQKEAYQQAAPEEQKDILMKKMESAELSDEQKLAIKLKIAALEGGNAEELKKEIAADSKYGEFENLSEEEKKAAKMKMDGPESELDRWGNNKAFPQKTLNLEEKIEMKITYQIEQIKKTENLSTQDEEKLRTQLREQYIKENR